MQTLADIKICPIFASALQRGLVVQLVRIHACHAWGRGFESRPDRKLKVRAKRSTFTSKVLFCPKKGR